MTPPDLIYPVGPNRILTQTFDEHVRRRIANGWQYYNGGIDWAIPNGSPVVAAHAGTATTLRDPSGYGNHVRILDASGHLTIYGHLLDFAVGDGETVAQGQVIGRSDNTGNSSGPHIHFELRDPRGNPLDPAPHIVGDEPVKPKQPPVAGEPARVDTPGSRLYFRSGPSQSAKAITLLPDKTPLELTGDVDGDYVEVRHIQTGWCHRDYVERG